MRIFTNQTSDRLNRFLKILRRTFLIIVALVLFLFIAIQTNFIQNWLVHIAARKLSKGLGTEVTVKSLSFSLFNRVNLEGTLIRDKQKDTLLYAGELKVRITDWFFLKDKAVLKYVGLEDAVIKMQRSDSVWNYQFIADYFSSPTPKQKDTGKLELNLKKVDLKNVRFIKDDRWRGEHMDVFAGGVVLDAENVDFRRNDFVINSIDLQDPFVRIQSLKALRPDSLKEKKVIDTGRWRLNPGGISAHVASISIKNGSLFLDSDQDKPSANFDGSHIELSQLTGTLKQVNLVKDTLRANLDLALRDRCGLEVKKLKADFRFTPRIMELDRFDLQTNRSHLTNYYAMRFQDFNRDFGKYETNVTMVAHFADARINSDDIAFFAPGLKSWKKEVLLGGNFTGTVADFSMKDLSARIGATTRINGQLKMKGLPDIDKTQITLTDGALQTNYFDVATLIPSMKGVSSPNLAALGTLIYRGNFSGTIHNFTTTGAFSTQLGGVKTNISLQLPKSGDPVYTGNIETNRFNIGKFLNDSSLGLADFKGKIIGSSFSVDRLKTTLEGTISSIEFNNYTYTNIVTNGTFQKKYFSGEIKIDDPNLDFTSTVEIDLTKSLPSFNIVGDLVHSNLRTLNLVRDSIELTGLLDVNFSGTNIDNFLGTAKFLNANIKKGRTELSFDSLNLVSNYNDSVKTLHLGSNDFNATIEGKFSIKDLSTSIQFFLTRYFPTYIKQPAHIPQNQFFTFRINTGDIQAYLPLFDRHISGFNDASITGTVDTRSNQLAMSVAVPSGQYDNLVFNGVDLKAAGTIDSLSFNGNISSIQVSDSLRFPNTRLHIVSQNDHSVVSIRTSADNTLNDADLLADVYTLSDGVRIQFRPSSFVLNEKKWTIEKAGELSLRTNLIDARNMKFTQGFQEISVETVPPADGGKTNNLAVRLKSVVLGDLTSLFFKHPRLQGVTSGTVTLNDVTGKLHPVGDLTVEQFRLDDDSIGLVHLNADVNLKDGSIPFTIESPNEGYRFNAKGSFNLRDTTGKPLLSEIDLDHSKVDILHKFLGDIFTDIHGQATGKLHINGDISSPDLLGEIRLLKASMKVNYTQVVYEIDSADIRFREEGIDFGSFTIRDRYKNTGEIAGKLYEKEFKDMRFDFTLKTNKLLLLDTKATDNQQFYGKAIGAATLKLAGPETDARMSITAEANDSSHIFIPNSVSRESGLADFIVFKQYGTEMVKESGGSNFNLTVDLALTANNKVAIDVILDEMTGDVIKAVGNGVLNIRAGTIDPLTIRGQYNIEQGSYVFNFQNFIRKPFLLLPDAGNYIKWTGDPFRADMHIDAQYTAERVSLSDLIGNLSLSPAVMGYRGDVYVIAQLRDKLNHPTIHFRLDFPQGSPIKSDNEFAQYLARLEKDQNEILNQVAFLVLFNSFAPPSTSGSSASSNPYSITSLGVNTISSVLTRSINKVVSNLLYKITGDKSLHFDVGTSIYSSSTLINSTGNISGTSPGNNRLDRTRIDLKLGYAFANDKIIITLGSDIDFNLGSSAILNGNTQWLPNVNIEFVLTRDKKLRLIVFNKNSLDFANSAFGRRNRQGASISYRKDFETFFGRKEKEVEVKTPADSIPKTN